MFLMVLFQRYEKNVEQNWIKLVDHFCFLFVDDIIPIHMFIFFLVVCFHSMFDGSIEIKYFIL